MSAIGRNEPCPCGSGRKFKHCCQRARIDEDSLRHRLRTAEGFVIPAMFQLAAEAFGDEYILEAWDEFNGWPDELVSPHDSRDFGTAFDPFFAFTFVPDEAGRELPDGWPTEPLALHVLAAGSDAIPPLHREFMRQACRSPASFFVVEAVAPGRSIDVKDVMTGRRFHVLEQTASRTFTPGDLTYARVLTLDGASILLGASPWIIPADWHIPLIDHRDRWRRGRLFTRADLEEYSFELLELYHEIAHALQHPQLPRLTNTDGDPLEPTTLTYRLAVPPADAIGRLTPLATLDGDVHISDEVVDAKGVRQAATLSWLKSGNRKHTSWDNTVLGTLRVEGTALVVDVNSTRRANRITREIRKLLGPDATLAETTTQDVEAMVAAARAGRAAEPADAAEPRSPEFAAIEAAIVREHMHAWVDTRVPALGNRTPRQAAKTPRGRERLEALLSTMGQTRSGTPQVDVGELRRTLGLD